MKPTNVVIDVFTENQGRSRRAIVRQDTALWKSPLVPFSEVHVAIAQARAWALEHGYTDIVEPLLPNFQQFTTFVSKDVGIRLHRRLKELRMTHKAASEEMVRDWLEKHGEPAPEGVE